MTKEMFEWITKWQRETFRQATHLTAAKHLREEVNELIECVVAFKPGLEIEKEYADCFLLLFGSASLYGLTFDDICKIINDKMEINVLRKWGSANEQGYIKHIEP